jgi:hypothetical protein
MQSPCAASIHYHALVPSRIIVTMHDKATSCRRREIIRHQGANHCLSIGKLRIVRISNQTAGGRYNNVIHREHQGGHETIP